MTAIIIGATAGLGRALCEEFARSGHDVIALASDQRDLDAMKAHLSTTYGVRVGTVAGDVSQVETLLVDLTAEIARHTEINALFIPLGVSSAEDELFQSTQLTERLLRLNFLSLVSVIQSVLPILKDKTGTRIVGFGSIATIRSRRRNIAYTAAKSALQSYFASLRHALSDAPVTIQYYQMGFIRTQQFYGRASPFPPITPERAAQIVLSDGARDFGVRFLPCYWTAISLILKALPWPIFKRLKF